MPLVEKKDLLKGQIAWLFPLGIKEQQFGWNG
jgi:hypothetical protein